jgi:uncharacterized protein with NRDE domain
MIDRPTEEAYFWTDHSVLAGRDQVARGSWLCFNPGTLKAAFVTNFRHKQLTALTSMENHNGTSSLKSRGHIPVEFVTHKDISPAQYAAQLEQDVDSYPSFNVCLFDIANNECGYFYNHNKICKYQKIEPGLHGISNAKLNDDSWKKVELGKQRLRELLLLSPSNDDGVTDGSNTSNTMESDLPWDALFDVLSDPSILEADPAKLPQTGYGAKYETLFSSIFLTAFEIEQGQMYGTRNQSILAVWNGHAELREKSIRADGSWSTVRHAFKHSL